MSEDVVRNYSGQGRPLQRRRRHSAGAAFPWRGSLAALAIIIAVVLLWITRDSFDITRCMPAGQRFSLVLADPVNNRNRIVQSRVWNSVPPSFGLAKAIEPIQRNAGPPEWVLNNLIRGQLYLLGNDISSFSDVIGLTKMSRIGSLIERLHWFMPGIESDYAGGLRLRKMTQSGMYYAVRGRILLFSPSRDELIRALTLTKEAAIDESTLSDLTRSGTEDLRGVVLLHPDDPLGSTFQSLAFAMRIDESSAHTKFRGIFNAAARERFANLVQGVSPRTLTAPPEGIVQVSLDFGKPLKEVWIEAGHAFDSPFFNASKWQTWEETKPGETPGLPQLATALFGPMGPGIRLSCVGIDSNEMMPAPLLAATLDAQVAALPELFKAIPPPPPGTMPWDMYPRVDSATNVVRLPLLGGPSIEPTVAVYGDDVLVSSSRTVAESLLKNPATAAPLPEKGNVYARITPRPCVEQLVEAGRQFLAFNGLRGYTNESFEQAAAEWTASAAGVQEITALASFGNDYIDAEFKLMCVPAPPVSEPAPTP
ncbi:MAG: hypothetical protein K1Y02_11045 [Candidatus Hydrogenedentes bacterium]|nr:hypothetical protein [Candidatus Hydrogenedentota bacterium]